MMTRFFRDSVTPPVDSPRNDLKGIGLLEVRVVGIHDKGFGVLELMLEEPGIPFVPPLRHPGHILDGHPLFGVVVDIEVGGLQHLEVKPIVLDLVATEVLGFERSSPGQQKTESSKGSEKPHPAGNEVTRAAL